MGMAKKSFRSNVETDYGTYECVFTPDERGFVATCPSVEGVVTWGKNRTEAKRMVREAIELGIEVKVQENMERGVAARPVPRKAVLAE